MEPVFFSHDPLTDGFQRHKTLGEADRAACASYELATQDGDTCRDDIRDICFGVVLQQYDEHGPLGDYYETDNGYGLAGVFAAQAEDCRSRAEAAEARVAELEAERDEARALKVPASTDALLLAQMDAAVLRARVAELEALLRDVDDLMDGCDDCGGGGTHKRIKAALAGEEAK